jgi:hypothetical protein
MSFGKHPGSGPVAPAGDAVEEVPSAIDSEEAPFTATRRPRVVVRRARLRSGPDPAAEATTPPRADPKTPRVFRVDTPLLPSPAVVDEPLAPAPARGRRAEPDRRPGRAVVVYRAEPVRDATADARYAALASQLAAIDETVVAIRQARSFTLVDAAFAGRWQRLGDAVSALRAQVGQRLDEVAAEAS